MTVMVRGQPKNKKLAASEACFVLRASVVGGSVAQPPTCRSWRIKRDAADRVPRGR